MIKKDTSHWINQSEIGLYLLDVRKYNTLTREEEKELIERIKAGDEKAKTALICSNLRFVISMAKQYQNQGLGLSDLISEGNIGLIKAAEKYDYEKEPVRFLSYAVWWVKQSILQSLHDNSRTIRLPVNKIAELNDLRKEAPKEYSDDDNHHAALLLPTVNQLDRPVDEEGGTLHDMIPDMNAVRPDVAFADDKRVLMLKLKGIMENLNDSEKYVITKYFGLDCEAVTLQDISEDMSLTKERVRQIKERAIKKLRFYSTELFELL